MRRKALRERGFGLVAAVFLLVVLAALAVAVASFSVTQHTDSGLDYEGARVYQAARAGIEWGVYQARKGGLSCPVATFTPATLADISVTVACVSSTYANANPSITVIQLTATACNKPGSVACTGGGQDYVERKVRATLDASQTSPVIFQRELHY